MIKYCLSLTCICFAPNPVGNFAIEDNRNDQVRNIIMSYYDIQQHITDQMVPIREVCDRTKYTLICIMGIVTFGGMICAGNINQIYCPTIIKCNRSDNGDLYAYQKSNYPCRYYVVPRSEVPPHVDTFAIQCNATLECVSYKHINC